MKAAIQFRAMKPESDFRIFALKTQYTPGPGFRGIAAYKVEGGVEIGMGMVGFDGWTPRAVMTHWYIRYPRCIEALWDEVLAYIAGHGRKTLVGMIPSDNMKSLRAVNHLGWQEVSRIADGWDEGVDIVIVEYRIKSALRRVA